MSKRFFIPTLAVVLMATTTLCGCKFFSKKPPTTGPGTGAETPLRPLGTTAIGERPLTMGEMDRSRFAAQTVYFDYDSARLRPGEASKLETVAAYMKSHSGVKLVVEGYCDERGTAEYNRALGERRALAAREELVHMGVDAGRISTISYGKENPADPGHDEAAWSRNRRCDFVVAG